MLPTSTEKATQSESNPIKCIHKIMSQLRDIINNRQDFKTLTHFFEEHTLVDENGFSHELFASYYCAYYLYKCICDGRFDDDIETKINSQADYWKDVVKTLLCLFEQNGKFDILLTMLKTMQGIGQGNDNVYFMVENPLVDTPDYDILCEAVSQFIYTKTNKPRAEEVLIRGMLIRGEKGIISYDVDTHKIKDKQGVNPYEELFYYTVVYDFKDGLKRIYDEQYGLTGNEANALSSIQRYLFNELCEVEHCDYTLTSSQLDKSITNILERLSKCSEDRVKGHVILVNSNDLRDKNITSIKIHENITRLNHFYLSSLCRIIVDEKNSYYHAMQDCLIETETNTLILCRNSIIDIPNSVTSIGDGAFCGCDGLTNINIPSSVTSIGDRAFSDCEKLVKITISYGVTSIGKETFKNCRSLTCIDIPNSVASIGDEAFSECEKLKKIIISDSVTSIGDGAFSGCEKLTKITIPDSVTSIGEETFWHCRSLICVEIPNSVTSIGKWAFYECTGLTNINIPSSVTSIGDGVFSDCEKLAKITISDGVTSIGKETFKNCRSLTCIDIPNSVKSIDDEVFCCCSGLTNIDIPSGVTSIGYGAFSRCSGLTKITIPDSVTSIDKCAFNSCDALERITVGSDNSKYYSSGDCLIETETNTLILGCKNSIIPNSVTSIGDHSFNNCTGLTSITIPDSVTKIAKIPFSGCFELTSVVFEDSNDWYVTTKDDCINKQNGIPVDVSDPEKNAINLKSTYAGYHWYKAE